MARRPAGPAPGAVVPGCRGWVLLEAGYFQRARGVKTYPCQYMLVSEVTGLKTPRSKAPRTKAPRTSRGSRSRAVPSVGKENRLATGRSQLPLKPFHHRQSSLSPVAVRVATLPNPARLLTRIQEGHSSGDSPAHRPSVHLDRPTSAHPAFLLDEQVNSRKIFVHSPRCQRTLEETQGPLSDRPARPMGARGRRGGRDRYRRHT